jgi:hypothetical protein
VLLEDGHGNWEVLFDDPLDERLMGVMLLAIVSDGVFQRLTFSHLGSSWWFFGGF